jgi:hypothetical protein
MRSPVRSCVGKLHRGVAATAADPRVKDVSRKNGASVRSTLEVALSGAVSCGRTGLVRLLRSSRPHGLDHHGVDRLGTDSENLCNALHAVPSQYGQQFELARSKALRNLLVVEVVDDLQ